LLGLDAGEFVYALFAERDEPVDAFKALAGNQIFDVLLRLEAELFFDFDFNPQSLAVEAVLIAQLTPPHGEVAVIDVFVGAAPSVMDAHRIVGRDRAVEKRPRRLPSIFVTHALKSVGPLPKI